MLVAETKRRVDQNRKLILETRQRVAWSLRSLNRWFAVSGGSDASEPALRAMVRRQLASGLLRPILDPKAWSGQGSGKPCVVCGEPITSQQLQIEPAQGHALESAVHVPCFLAWYGESNGLDGEESPEESNGTSSPA